MSRIQINLLPPEVLEKRKAEKIITRIVMGIVALFSVMVLGFFYIFQLVGVETGKVQELQAENARYEIEIVKIADFESNKILVDERQRVIDTAIADKYSYSKWLNNLSLLIPNEVWLKDLTIGGGSVSFSGSAVADSTTRRLGQKSVAKWLVRLAEMDDLSDVWLSSSNKTEGATREIVGGETPAGDTDMRDLMKFSVTGKLTPSNKANSDASAPPDQGGQT